MKRLATLFVGALVLAGCGSNAKTSQDYSYAPKVVHVHSTPEHEYEIAKGAKDKTFTFSIKTPGQVAVESHGLDVTIVQLVVE